MLPAPLRFVTQLDAWAREEMRRRRFSQIGTDQEAVSVYLCSPEDTILHKLEWYRAGGEVSDRQWQDVLEVFRVQSQVLDMAYLRRWAAERQLTELLERALRDGSNDA